MRKKDPAEIIERKAGVLGNFSDRNIGRAVTSLNILNSFVDYL